MANPNNNVRDIYGQQVNYGGAFSPDAASLTFDMRTTDGAVKFNSFITEQLGVNYAQNISRVYDLRDSKYYLVQGRTQGTVQLAGLTGPNGLQQDFYAKFGDVCQLAKNSFGFQFKSACASGDGNPTQAADMTVRFAVIQSVGNNISSGDFLIHESINMMFLRYERSGAVAAGLGAGAAVAVT